MGLVTESLKVVLDFLGISASASLSSFESEVIIDDLEKALQAKKVSFRKYCLENGIDSQQFLSEDDSVLVLDFVDRMQLKMVAARVRSDGIRRYLPEDPAQKENQTAGRGADSAPETLNPQKEVEAIKLKLLERYKDK